MTLDPRDFTEKKIEEKIQRCASLLRDIEARLQSNGYEVQTVRIATNPFGEWLLPSNQDTMLGGEEKDAVVSRLKYLNDLLGEHDINFCSLGPSMSLEQTSICPLIVSIFPGRFSCSAKIDSCDTAAAKAASKCVKMISSVEQMEALVNNPAIVGDASHLLGGLGNFRFCTASYVKEGIPFFPAAKARSLGKGADNCIGFALGLENGSYAGKLLKESKSIANVQNVFSANWRRELLPIQKVCEEYIKIAKDNALVEYLGIDTSLNPSLDRDGSVGRSIETLDEVRGNFGQGSLSAASAVTTALQSIPDIKITGYCGLMLPVLEDQRLSELAMMTQPINRIDVQKLLCISSVCGVGIDTVPVPGNVSDEHLSSLILDVAALAGRWNKQLSCRVFPVPNGNAGEMTKFDSPYMCNSCIFELE